MRYLKGSEGIQRPFWGGPVFFKDLAVPVNDLSDKGRPEISPLSGKNRICRGKVHKRKTGRPQGKRKIRGDLCRDPHILCKIHNLPDSDLLKQFDCDYIS